MRAPDPVIYPKGSLIYLLKVAVCWVFGKHPEFTQQQVSDYLMEGKAIICNYCGKKVL